MSDLVATNHDVIGVALFLTNFTNTGDGKKRLFLSFPSLGNLNMMQIHILLTGLWPAPGWCSLSVTPMIALVSVKLGGPHERAYWRLPAGVAFQVEPHVSIL